MTRASIRAPLRPLSRLARIRGDRRGSAITEFAIVTPVMLLMMMGIGDMLYQAYAQSLLNGALQKAGRDSGIQDAAAQSAAIDSKVVAVVASIVKNPTNSCAATPTAATWCSTRKSYDSFTAVGPEPFTDSNNNGVRDAGECFTDMNGNGTWDADPGASGQGGAGSIALYTIRITYPRLFPVARLIGWTSVATISATTLLKNQPYATQTTNTPTTVCT